MRRVQTDEHRMLGIKSSEATFLFRHLLLSMRLPSGKLSVHEEFPDATVEAITPFLHGMLRPTAIA
jgi:hypothetical protein